MTHSPNHPSTDNPYSISRRTGYTIHTYEALHLVILSILITFFLLSPNIFLSTLFSKVWNLRPSYSMTAFLTCAPLQLKFPIYYKGHVRGLEL